MNLSRSRYFIPLTILLLILSACTPSSQSAPTDTSDPETPPQLTNSVELVESQISWTDLSEGNSCYISPPTASLKICAKNLGEESVSPQSAAVSLPAFLDRSAFHQVLGSMPGGEWLPPYPISLTGIPGVEEGADGTIIISSNPAPDAPASGIIIVTSIPATSDVSSALIVIQSMPDPLSAEGIAIVNTKESTQALTGGISLDFKITPTSQHSSVPSLGFAEVAADITQDHYEVNGKVASFKPSPDDNLSGIIWGGLVANADDLALIDDNSEALIDDNKPAISWGSMPSGAVGVIIVDVIPSPGYGAEGIIIILGKDFSHVMGPIVIDMPADGSSQGIISIDSLPASPTSGVAWTGLAWNPRPGTEGSSQGIVIQKMPSSSLASLLADPDVFGLPEGMVPMMGEGGFGPGPMAFGTIALQHQGLGFHIPAGETDCLEISLNTMLPQLLDSGGQYSFDSFFDVYVNNSFGTLGMMEKVIIISALTPLGENCTPEPITPVSPDVITVTPTSGGPSPTPTPTPRTGLPTVTPASRPSPTPTVERRD